ncbi:MAG: pirin family protein [Brevibacillus sp.]|nr:pirin family protein [Brevibacillus sp.]
MKVAVYPPARQATGSFDGGKITEQKPIGFPGEGSAVKRVGPLFYWSWFHAEEEGYIPPHPHQAFEILTYVIKGKAEHGDSLGTKSTVGEGGAQVMQTGSGVYHEERMIGPDMHGFQIWFEPFLSEASQKTPTYNQYEHQDFPLLHGEGYLKKTVIGEGSPIQLDADANMWDVQVQPGKLYRHPLAGGRSLAALAIEGSGTWLTNGGETSFRERDFILLHASGGSEPVLKAPDENGLRLILIDVPTEVDYPLYPKG